MKHAREIKFRTNGFKTRLTAGRTLYQGQVVHNDTLSSEETRRRFTEYMKIGTRPLVDLYLNGLTEFITQEIEKGNRLDFGGFTVGVKLRGGFPAANAPFDKGCNSLAVEITPGRRIRKAVDALKPVNDTVEQPTIYGAVEVEPEIRRGKSIMYDTVLSDGHRKVQCNGKHVGVHPDAADEGVWIENDAGRRLATGTVIASDAATCDFTLDGPVETGVHWLVIAARYRDEPNLLLCRRRLTVIDRPEGAL